MNKTLVKRNIHVLWVSADTPQTRCYELLVVLFSILRAPPSRLLPIGNDLKEKGASIYAECRKVTQAKGGMKPSRHRVAKVNRKSYSHDPSSFA